MSHLNSQHSSISKQSPAQLKSIFKTIFSRLIFLSLALISLVIAFFFISFAIAIVVLVLAFIFTRMWWLRRKIQSQTTTNSPGDVDGEYYVITEHEELKTSKTKTTQIEITKE